MAVVVCHGSGWDRLFGAGIVSGGFFLNTTADASGPDPNSKR